MSDRKTYVILGLGRFGLTLAKQLTDYNQDVIAIDKDISKVERVSSYVANALCLDYTDIDALKEAGIEDVDVGVVTSASMLDQEIMGLVNLKELGVPEVLAKADSSKIAILLKKVGADKTFTPEHDMAIRCAKKLVSSDILELFNVDNDHTMFELKVQKNWIGHSLKELDLRNRFSINVIGVNREGKMNMNIDPDDKFKEDDVVLLVGPNDIFKKLNSINKI